MKEPTLEELSSQIIEKRMPVKHKILIVFGVLFVLLIIYLIYLQIIFAEYGKYEDSAIEERYNNITSAFSEIERYHLQYETKTQNSIVSEIYYIKDKIFFQIVNKDDQRIISITMPKRSGMGLIKKNNFRGECKVVNTQTWPVSTEEEPCLFELGIPHTTMAIPTTFTLRTSQSDYSTEFLMGGKIYGYEDKINNITAYCVYSKHPQNLISYTFIAQISRIYSSLAKLLLKLPPRIIQGSTFCYSDKGVLISTIEQGIVGRKRLPLYLEYEFNNSFLEEIPYYSDFQRFIKKASIRNNTYYEISFGEDKTYLKDLDNYMQFDLFGEKNYLISGCSQGINMIDEEQECYTRVAPPYSFVNETFIPIKFEENKTIGTQDIDCFSQTTTGSEADIKKEFCIMDGGYIVSEKEYWTYKVGSGPSQTGYNATDIKQITERLYKNKLILYGY